MSWVDQLKDSLPEYAKDIKLNLDAVINRSTIDAEHATYLSIAAAFATGNAKLLTFIVASATDEVEKNAALTAGSIMAQNNVWQDYHAKLGAFETTVAREGDEVVTTVTMPEVPGVDAVLEAAEKFYEFVNGKTK